MKEILDKACAYYKMTKEEIFSSKIHYVKKWVIIYQMVKKGYTYKEIGDFMGVSNGYISGVVQKFKEHKQLAAVFTVITPEVQAAVDKLCGFYGTSLETLQSKDMRDVTSKVRVLLWQKLHELGYTDTEAARVLCKTDMAATNALKGFNHNPELKSEYKMIFND